MSSGSSHMIPTQAVSLDSVLSTIPSQLADGVSGLKDLSPTSCYACFGRSRG